jgi:hypothetical protein
MPELWEPKPFYGTTCDDEILGRGGGWRHIDALTRLAIHESGHAVAHRLINRDCVSILLTLNTGAVFYSPSVGRDAVVCLAGPAAELRLMRERRGYRDMERTCGCDYYNDLPAIDDPEEIYEPAWDAAKALIADATNWRAVMALADELRRHRRRRGGIIPGWRVKQVLEELLPRHP